jgi:hypothetical protein
MRRDRRAAAIVLVVVLVLENLVGEAPKYDRLLGYFSSALARPNGLRSMADLSDVASVLHRFDSGSHGVVGAGGWA